MSWTLDELVCKLFQRADMKRTIAREMSKHGWHTPTHHASDFEIKSIGFTAREIAQLIGKDDSSEIVINEITTHLREMKGFVDYIKGSPNGRPGRPPRRYYLNDHFWGWFHRVESEDAYDIGISLKGQ